MSEPGRPGLRAGARARYWYRAGLSGRGGGELAPFQPSKQAEFAVESVINHYSGDPSAESVRAPCRLVPPPPLTSLPAGNSNAQNIN